MARQNSSAAYSLMAVMFTVLLLIVSWKLILPGYAANKIKISQLETEINQANSKKEQLDQAKSNLTSANTAYQALTVSVAEDADEPNLISELEQIAVKNGLALPNINISPAGSETGVDEEGNAQESETTGAVYAIGINVSGTYDQLGAFITSLEKSIKFMNIKALTYTDNEGDQISLSLTLHAYARQAAVDESQQ